MRPTGPVALGPIMRGLQRKFLDLADGVQPRPPTGPATALARARANAITDQWREADWPLAPKQVILRELPTPLTIVTAEFGERAFSHIPPLRLEAARDALDQPGSLLIVGGLSGRGKTTLACWLALRDCLTHEWDMRNLTGNRPQHLRPGYRQFYARAWPLMAALKRYHRSGDETDARARLARSADLAVFDDLHELDTIYEFRTMADILVTRAGNNKRTILLTEHSQEKLLDTLGGDIAVIAARQGMYLSATWTHPMRSTR